MNLNNLHILLTRPLLQTENLATQIKQLGGHPILFPTLEIQSDANKQTLDYIQQLAEYDLAVFISPNAVLYAMPMILQYYPWPKSVKIAVIGEGTARELQNYQLIVDYCPQTQFSSESLLALINFVLTDKKILIFKGRDGRELLATELRQRGAIVNEAVVYRRLMPKMTADTILSQQKIDIIVCTSVSALQNLVAMATQQLDCLQNKQLLVSSERIAATAKDLGFVKTPIVADNATDTAVIKKLGELTCLMKR